MKNAAKSTSYAPVRGVEQAGNVPKSSSYTPVRGAEEIGNAAKEQLVPGIDI